VLAPHAKLHAQHSGRARQLKLIPQNIIPTRPINRRLPAMHRALKRVFDIDSESRIYRYIQKPWDRQELKVTVKRALESYALALENRRLLKELEAANERLKDENAYLKQSLIRIRFSCNFSISPGK
jgi:hypothetical protein